MNLTPEQKELLSAHLDGELNPTESALVHALLERPEARDYLEGLERYRALIQRHARVVVPADFSASVIKALDTDYGDVSRPTNMLPQREAKIHALPTATWRTPVMAAAAAAVVAVGLFFASSLTTPQTATGSAELARERATRELEKNRRVFDKPDKPTDELNAYLESLPELRENGRMRRAMDAAETENAADEPAKDPAVDMLGVGGSPAEGAKKQPALAAKDKQAGTDQKGPTESKEKGSVIPKPEEPQSEALDRIADAPANTGGGGGGVWHGTRESSPEKRGPEAPKDASKAVKEGQSPTYAGGEDREVDLKLHGDASALQVCNDVLRVSRLYGDAKIQEQPDVADERNGEPAAEYESVEIELPEGKVEELLVALDKLSTEQNFGKLELPAKDLEQLRKDGSHAQNLPSQDESGKARGYLPEDLKSKVQNLPKPAPEPVNPPESGPGTPPPRKVTESVEAPKAADRPSGAPLPTAPSQPGNAVPPSADPGKAEPERSESPNATPPDAEADSVKPPSPVTREVAKPRPNGGENDDDKKLGDRKAENKGDGGPAKLEKKVRLVIRVKK